MCHENWYAYVYPKSVAMFSRTKIITPSIAIRSSFTLDKKGELYFVGSGGGGGGGYGITLKNESESYYKYILGLLNSKLLDFFLKNISSTFRGGYYAYNKQYIEKLPIHPINFNDPQDVKKHNEIVKLVEQMLKFNEKLSKTKIPTEKELIQRQIDTTDKQIDNLVYELYGLTDDEIQIVENLS